MDQEVQERSDTQRQRAAYISTAERMKKLGPEREALFQRNRTALTGSFQALCKIRADLADGSVSERREKLQDSGSLTREIKSVASYLGADLVGIACLPQSYVFLEKNVPHAYVISVAVEMDYGLIKLAPGRKTSDELWRAYNSLAEITVHLAAHIRGMGYTARAHHQGTGELLLVPCAVDAGLGELSKMGFLITKKYGPRVRLAAVTTDLPMEVDQPVDVGVQDFCEKCSKCARHCPSSAIPEKKTWVRGVRKWQLDGDRCIETFSKTFGCTMCIRYCPWNKPDSLLHRIPREAATKSSLARTILTRADDWFYGR